MPKTLKHMGLTALALSIIGAMLVWSYDLGHEEGYETGYEDITYVCIRDETFAFRGYDYVCRLTDKSQKDVKDKTPFRI
jgi:hypothetical protein